MDAGTLIEQYAAKLHVLSPEDRIGWLTQSNRLVSECGADPAQAVAVIEFLKGLITEYTKLVHNRQYHESGDVSPVHGRAIVRAYEDYEAFFEPLLTFMQCALAEDARPFE